MASCADVIADLHRSCTAAAAVDTSLLAPSELGQLVIAIGTIQDRLRSVHAVHVMDADRARVWPSTGARNVQSWLADRLGITYGEAVRTIKLGDVLERSERVLRAVLAGRLSSSAAEQLHAAVVHGPAGADIDALLDALLGPEPMPCDEPSPETSPQEHSDGGDHADPAPEQPAGDGSGLPFGQSPIDAPAGPPPAKPSPKQARDAADTFNRLNRPGDDELERIHRKRALSFGTPVDGLVPVNALVPVLGARILRNALDHIAGTPCDNDDRTLTQRYADALTALAEAYSRGEVTGGRERPQVIVTIDADTYLGHDHRDALTSMGDRLPAVVARRLAEHAELTWILHSGLEILAQGRSTRLATEAQWKALIARDGCCRWPGCTIPANWCEADHIVPWEDGGLTDINDLDLLCSHHHHVSHRKNVTRHYDGTTFMLELPDGTLIRLEPKGIIAERQRKSDVRRTPPGQRPGDHEQTGLFDAA